MCDVFLFFLFLKARGWWIIRLFMRIPRLVKVIWLFEPKKCLVQSQLAATSCGELWRSILSCFKCKCYYGLVIFLPFLLLCLDLCKAMSMSTDLQARSLVLRLLWLHAGNHHGPSPLTLQQAPPLPETVVAHSVCSFRGFHQRGYPHSWMVYNGTSNFMANPIYKWMITRGTPYDLGNLHVSHHCNLAILWTL